MLLIEDTEVKMWESIVNTSAKCTIKNDVFSCLRNEETLFNSEIYKYEDVSVVACREPRFGELYLNIAVYNDTFERAWPLITVPCKLDTAIIRLCRDNFLVWTNSQMPEHTFDMKQCSFCRLNENEKVDNITIDFHALHNMQLLNGSRVLIEYSQHLGGMAGIEKKTITSLVLLDRNGKILKVFYEAYSDGKSSFTYKLVKEKMQLTIREQDAKNVKTTTFNLAGIGFADESITEFGESEISVSSVEKQSAKPKAARATAPKIAAKAAAPAEDGADVQTQQTTAEQTDAEQGGAQLDASPTDTVPVDAVQLDSPPSSDSAKTKQSVAPPAEEAPPTDNASPPDGNVPPSVKKGSQKPQ